MNQDGTPYRSDQRFTCKAQTDGFKKLLDNMAARPQDYVSDRGRLTTNSVEGFHGLALLYRGKRTDLGHTHYVWKVFCLVAMGVDMPTAAVASILQEQSEWTKKRQKTSTKENLHKR